MDPVLLEIRVETVDEARRRRRSMISIGEQPWRTRHPASGRDEHERRFLAGGREERLKVGGRGGKGLGRAGDRFGHRARPGRRLQVRVVDGERVDRAPGATVACPIPLRG